MSKIDLIISAIEKAEWTSNSCEDAEFYTKALAAARELKALKPVAWTIDNYYFSKLPDGATSSDYTKLYALDEVKHD